MVLGSCPAVASAFINFTVTLVQNLPNEKKGLFVKLRSYHAKNVFP